MGVHDVGPPVAEPRRQLRRSGGWPTPSGRRGRRRAATAGRCWPAARARRRPPRRRAGRPGGVQAEHDDVVAAAGHRPGQTVDVGGDATDDERRVLPRQHQRHASARDRSRFRRTLGTDDDSPTLRNVLLPDLDLHLFGEGTHRRLWDVARRPRRSTDGRHALRGVGARTPGGVDVVGDWNDWGDGTPLEPQARVGHLGGVVADARGRAPLQVRGRRRRRSHDAEGRPDGAASRAPAGQRQRGRRAEPAHEWGDDAWMADARAAARRSRCASTRCTSARGARRRSVRATSAEQLADHVARARLHPRRAAAGRRAPVRRIVGLPGHRLLRADGALRHARRLPLRSSTPCTSAASA